MAHPLTLPDFEERLPDLVSAGLRGIEAYYGEYSEAERERIAAIGRRLGLLLTGGSDYHGPEYREGRDLGSVPIPDEAVEALLSAISGVSGSESV